MIEAATLVAAVRTKESTLRAIEPTVGISTLRHNAPDKFEEEAAYLQKVAAAVEHSSLVATVVANRQAADELDGAHRTSA